MPKSEGQKTVLRLTNIHKSFGGVKALQGVDFELKPGEIHALVGENGAGKSTLIKVVMGVHQPDEGEIFIDEKSVKISGPLEAQKLGVAAIYQEPTLYMDLDIAENIFMGHHLVYGNLPVINWKKLHSEAKKPLIQLGRELDTHTKVHNLTIAQMQMVEVAKALTMKAHIMIMDEPTSVLTQHEVKELFAIVRKLRDQGTSIIFITHRLEEIFEIADRVTIFRDGHQVGTSEIKKISQAEVIHMMVGRELGNLFPKIKVKSGEEILRVDNLTKAGIFKDISFVLHRGEILGMAGLVGARRTDVGKAIFGIEPADSGTITIKGKLQVIHTPSQAMGLGLAYVPEDRQSFGLVLGMTITENITLTILENFSRLGLINKEEEGVKSVELANQLEVRAAGLWQRAHELSGGNQQKVVLAKWLGTRPDILILDEPTRGIDVGTKAAVHKLMGEIASQGVGIIMISSELPEILGMSDRVLVMCEGQLTGDFPREKATQENIMGSATKRSEVK
jgi:rhamnose transport system ATP-binding protein